MSIFSKVRVRVREFLTVERTPAEVADMVEAFINGEGDDWDWDDLISVPIRNAELEKIVRECAAVHERFAPREPGHYTNDEGTEFLRRKVTELRKLQQSLNEG